MAETRWRFIALARTLARKPNILPVVRPRRSLEFNAPRRRGGCADSTLFPVELLWALSSPWQLFYAASVASRARRFACSLLSVVDALMITGTLSLSPYIPRYVLPSSVFNVSALAILLGELDSISPRLLSQKRST